MVIIYLLFGLLVVGTFLFFVIPTATRNVEIVEASEEVEDAKAEIEAANLRKLAAELRAQLPAIEGDCVESSDAQPK